MHTLLLWKSLQTQHLLQPVHSIIPKVGILVHPKHHKTLFLLISRQTSARLHSIPSIQYMDPISQLLRYPTLNHTSQPTIPWNRTATHSRVVHTTQGPPPCLIPPSSAIPQRPLRNHRHTPWPTSQSHEPPSTKPLHYRPMIHSTMYLRWHSRPSRDYCRHSQ